MRNLSRPRPANAVPLLPQTKCEQRISSGDCDVLLAADCVGHRRTLNAPGQCHLPKKLARSSIQCIEVPVLQSRRSVVGRAEGAANASKEDVGRRGERPTVEDGVLSLELPLLFAGTGIEGPHGPV